MANPEELLNKKLTDVAKSNPGGDMWFIKAPSWEGWYLEDEENSGNFSYWHLYDEDDHHKGTLSVEDGIITLLPRNLSENKMTNEQLRMQMLSGIITEGEYKAKLEEKASLNESMIGGIVGVGAINQIPSRAKTDYEMAFEHFLGEKFEIKPNRERDDIKDLEEDDSANDMDQKLSDLDEDVVKGPNVKEVNGKWRVLSGKSGKMWSQTYDSKKDAEDAIKAYHANK